MRIVKFENSLLPFTVTEGKLRARLGGVVDKPTMLVDRTSGLVKFGELEDVKAYHDTLAKAFSDFSLQLADLVLLQVDTVNPVTTCALVNWVFTCTPSGEAILHKLGQPPVELDAWALVFVNG